jgi:hypothetical protein
MAKEEGIALSDSQADAIYSQFHSGDRELEDDELANVSGGSCSTAAELSKKYGAVQPDSVCGEFVWAYVYFGRRPQRPCLPELPFLHNQQGCRPEDFPHARHRLLLREAA